MKVQIFLEKVVTGTAPPFALRRATTLSGSIRFTDPTTTTTARLTIYSN